MFGVKHAVVASAMLLTLVGCGQAQQVSGDTSNASVATESATGEHRASDADNGQTDSISVESQESGSNTGGDASSANGEKERSATEIRASLNISEDFRDTLIHGEKPTEYQKYIVMHDTEGEADAQSVVDWWDSNGNLVAAHFVVNKDGSIVQCVPIDKIAHHAGYGDAGHNELFGVTDESRDDKRGTVWRDDSIPDYGMNSYSIGIEMVHVSEGGADYPEEQLRAVDGLISYIDAYYGFESEIIDHNDWRTGNSDCSEEFQPYLRNLQQTRTHDGS